MTLVVSVVCMHRKGMHTLLAGALAGSAACAQTAPVTAPAAASAASTVPARTDEARDSAVQEVIIRARRPADVELRKRATASKVIISRDEIERFGDTSLGQVLQRLPGVTVQGSGDIRLRGMGNGYTQILLDGERTQAGVSLDSIDPSQIERIEIVRAPTAETGARAVAGTINIITKEGVTRRLNDVKLSLSQSEGAWVPRASWSREDKLETLDYSLSLAVAQPRGRTLSTVHTVNTDPAEEQDVTENKRSDSQSAVLHARGRLVWRGQGGAMFTLTPFGMVSNNQTQQRSAYEPALLGAAPYDTSDSDTHTRIAYGRLSAMWRQPLGEGRLEGRASLGRSQTRSRTERIESTLSAWPQDVLYNDAVLSRGRSASLGLKHSVLLVDEHSLVSGLELEREVRNEARTSLIDGSSASSDYAGNYDARVQRTAAYVQDEWSITPQWAAHAGLRWEGLKTQGSNDDGPVRNQSSVWSPLLHALWRPVPNGQDQVRISLTRSYRSPNLTQLIGASWSAKGNNSATNPDRTGNPDLRPELATGLDVSMERYLPTGGMLSVTLFHRRISDLIRSVVTAQPQAGGGVRYLSQPMNLGRASSQGVEMEVKLRLNEWWLEAPATEVRAGLSLYRSRVEGIQGPNNRIDEQADGTLNLGVEHKFDTLWTLGGNLNYTPGYTTRLSQTQWAVRDGRRNLDLYALWQLRPDLRWRFSVANVLARDTRSSSTVGSETSTTFTQGEAQWRVQLEMKL